jgi:glucose/arabinose dehydrogenase
MKYLNLIYLIPFSLVLACTSASVKTDNKQTTDIHPEVADYVQKWDERKIAALPVYNTSGLCGGLPKINLKTAPGFCVGLIDNGEGTVFPRTALQVDEKNILLVDMGGWKKSNGKLYMLTHVNGKYTRRKILDAAQSENALIKNALDRPHLLLRGPDQKIYLSSTSMIVRLDPFANPIENSFQVVISGLPNLGLHPLKVFTFDDQENLYVNVGSATNVCKKQGVFFDQHADCSEVEDWIAGQGQVRKYTKQSDGTYSKNFVVFSKGLRNSMGLLWNQIGQNLIQAENSRDNIFENDTSLSNTDLPHEEFNVLVDGGRYGWPYCYDNNLNNPEWTGFDCRSQIMPHLLMPAHSSPLSLMMYRGNLFPGWYKNRMLISLHGYEPRGHRIIAYLRDDKGLPTGAPLSIVYGWDATKNQPTGSPVGLSEMSDGSVLIVEDKNRKVLRLFFDPKLGNGKPVNEIPTTVQIKDTEKTALMKTRLQETLGAGNAPLFARIQNELIDKHCTGCHAGADARGLELTPYDFEGNESRILAANKQRQILSHLRGEDSFAQMPPDGFPSTEEKNKLIDLYVQWLNKK